MLMFDGDRESLGGGLLGLLVGRILLLGGLFVMFLPSGMGCCCRCCRWRNEEVGGLGRKESDRCGMKLVVGDAFRRGIWDLF